MPKFLKKWVSYLVQNLMLNRLTPVSNPKNEKAKSVYALFKLLFFILIPTWLNKGFYFFPDYFEGGKFLPSRSEAKTKNWFRQKNIFSLINLVPSVPSFYIRTKFRLKNRVTTVHLLQCNTNFFIRLCFSGRNLLLIKECPSWEASINIKKGFLILLPTSTFV